MSARITASGGTGGGSGPRPGGGSGPRPGGGSGTGPKGRTLAAAIQAVALIAVGLFLIVAALTAPAAPPAEPTPVRPRPATEQERRDYDARRLAELLEERWRSHQQEGATPAGTDVTPDPQPAPSPREDWSR